MYYVHMFLQFEGITRNKAGAFSLTESVISSDVDKLFLCQSSFFSLTFLERRRLPTLPHTERCELGRWLQNRSWQLQ